MTGMFGCGYPPPGNGLAGHGGPLAVRLQRLLIYADLLYLQLAVLGYDPEIYEVLFLGVLRVVKFHVGEKAVAVDGAGEVDVVVSHFQMIAVQRVVEGE